MTHSPPTDTGGIEISATRIRAYQQCARRWGFKAILGLAEPPSKALEFGSELHKLLEDYFAFGILPKGDAHAPTLARKGILSGLYPLRSDSLEAERPISLATVYGWAMPGTADLFDAATARLYDHKTTASAKWIPDAEKLKADPQASVYALAIMRERKLQRLDCRWVYHVKDTETIDRVDFTITREAAEALWASLQPTIGQMLGHYTERDAGQFEIKTLDANESFCDSYGRRCPFEAQCKGGEKMSDAKAALLARAKATKAKPKVAEPAPEPPAKGEVGAGVGALLDSVWGADINPPEGASEPKPVEKVDTSDQVKLPLAAPAPTTKRQETSEQATLGDAPAGLLIVAVDCVPISKTFPPTAFDSVQRLSDLAREAEEHAATSSEVVDWRLTDYGKGPAVLAYHFEKWLDENPQTGVILVDGFSPLGKALLPSLEKVADVIFRGLR